MCIALLPGWNRNNSGPSSARESPEPEKDFGYGQEADEHEEYARTSTIPEVAHTYWFHKNDPQRINSSGLPPKYQKNIKTFLDLNPDLPLNLWTDNPERIEDTLPSHASLTIRHNDEVPAAREYPPINEYIHGVIPHIPASAKDLQSKLVLQSFGGTSWDIDVQWKSRIPKPFNLNGVIAAHQGFELQVIAYTGGSHLTDGSDFMYGVLQKDAEAIKQNFDRRVDGDQVTLRVVENHNGKDFLSRPGSLVHTLGVEHFSEAIMESYSNPVEKYLDFKVPEIEGKWYEEGRGLREIKAKITTTTRLPREKAASIVACLNTNVNVSE